MKPTSSLIDPRVRCAHWPLPHLPIETIKATVARHTGTSTRAIDSRSRPANVAFARQIAMTIAWQILVDHAISQKGANARVAALFRRTGHAVINARLMIRARCETDDADRRLFAVIRADLTAQTFIDGDGI